MPSREQVIELLKKCQDPELHMDVWTLGLIYNLDVSEKKINIRMTFTSPACPYGEMLTRDIIARIKHFLGNDIEVTIDVVFDPPWKPSEEVLATLGFG